MYVVSYWVLAEKKTVIMYLFVFSITAAVGVAMSGSEVAKLSDTHRQCCIKFLFQLKESGKYVWKNFVDARTAVTKWNAQYEASEKQSGFTVCFCLSCIGYITLNMCM